MLTRFSLRQQALVGAVLVMGFEAAAAVIMSRRAQRAELELSSQEAVLAANAASTTMTVIVRDIKTLLSAASRLAAVRSARTDPAGCRNALREAMELAVTDKLVTNIFVVGPGGGMECHTGDPAALFRRPSPPWPELSPLIAAGTLLNVASPFYGEVSQEWVAVMGLPTSDGRVLAAAVDLAKLSNFALARSDRAANTERVIVTVADAKGFTVLRSSNFANSVGQRLPFLPEVTDIDQQTQGLPTETGPDGAVQLVQMVPVVSPDREGRPRAWVSRRVAGLQWIIYAGISVEPTHPVLSLFSPEVRLLTLTTGVAPIAALSFYILMLAKAHGQLARLTAAVRTGDPSKIVIEGPTEVRALAQSLRSAIEKRSAAEIGLAALNVSLERQVAERSEALTRQAAEMAEANRKLQEWGREREQFIAVLSHELRTPLSSILGLAEAMQEGVYGEITSKQRGVVDRLHSAGSHLLALVKDLLDLLITQERAMVLDRGPVQVTAVVKAAVEMVQQQAAAKNITINIQSHDAVQIAADSRRLLQVFVNLLTNAIKFTPNGRSVGIETRLSPPGSVNIRFWDHGIGIHPDDREQLFKPFTQLHKGLARQYDGTGLGLALSRSLVELHGGSISVDSVPGVGSSFLVQLPIEPPSPLDSQPRGPALN